MMNDQHPDTNKDYLTIEEACHFLCCSRSRLFEVRKTYDIKVGGLGKKCYRKKDLEKIQESTFG